MSTEVGRIDLGLDINRKMFNRQLSGIAGGAERQVKSVFGGMGLKIGKTLGVAIGGAAIASFTKSALKLGSDLTEVQNVVDVTFRQMSGSVNTFASTAIDTFGLSETLAKQYMGTYGAMSKSMGMTEKQAFDMAKAITGLTGDTASFFNLSSEAAYTKLKSIWTGETESLKELGIVMTQTNLDNYALNNGLGKTTKTMTEQEKLMLRYQYVMSRLSDAQGDFARNSDSWANQTRVLSLRFDALKATLGQGLINLFTPIVKMINTVLARLQVLAEAFKRFTEMLTGVKSQSSGLGSVATDISDATSGMADGVDSLGNESSKAAKKIQGALAGFDELNIVGSTPEDTGGGGASSSFDSGLIGDMTSSTEAAANKAVSSLDKVKSKLDEISNVFKTGFTIGFGESNFDNITNGLNNIKESLNGIFTSPEVTNASDGWANRVALSAGKVTGSLANIGTTVAELFTGSFDKYLSQNTEFLRGKIASLFNISGKRAEIWGNISTAIADIFSVFRSDEAKQLGADIIGIFANSGTSIAELGWQYGNDFLSYITSPITGNKDAVKTAIEGTLGSASTVVNAVKTNIDEAFKAIWSSYTTYVQPAWENMNQYMTRVWGGIVDGYNEYLAPTLDKIATKFSNLIENHITPLFGKASDLAGSIIFELSRLWNFISPFVSWLLKNVIAVISVKLELLWNVVELVFKQITTTVSSFIGTAQGLLDFVVGIFTGDWDRAWNGIKKIFTTQIDLIKNTILNVTDYFKDQFKTAFEAVEKLTGVKFDNIKSGFVNGWNKVKETLSSVPSYFKEKFDAGYKAVKDAFSPFVNFFDGLGNSIKSTFKGALNGVISHFNRFINWVNSKLKFSWDGLKIAGNTIFEGGTVQLAKIPAIPQLAQGGIVDSPTLAMIGEAGKEAVVPLENTNFVTTIASAIANEIGKVISAAGSNNNNNGDVVLKIGEMEFARIAIKAINNAQRAAGTTMLEI